jgi:hypothetical protein
MVDKLQERINKYYELKLEVTKKKAQCAYEWGEYSYWAGQADLLENIIDELESELVDILHEMELSNGEAIRTGKLIL